MKTIGRMRGGGCDSRRCEEMMRRGENKWDDDGIRVMHGMWDCVCCLHLKITNIHK